MVDLRLTDDGDLVIGPNGDLELVWGDEQIAQEVIFRLKTTIGDWLLAPHVGADLESFIGEPNVPLVRAAIEKQIRDSLTQDNLLFLPEVSAISIGDNEIFILIEFGSLEDDERVIQVQSGLSLAKGLVFSRATVRNLN